MKKAIVFLFATALHAVSYKMPIFEYDNRNNIIGYTFPSMMHVAVLHDMDKNIIGFQSSDGTIHYEYRYKNGFIAYAIDHVNNIHIHRTRTLDGKLVSETIKNHSYLHLHRNEDGLLISLSPYFRLHYTQSDHQTTVRLLDAQGNGICTESFSNFIKPEIPRENNLDILFTSDGNPKESIVNEYNELIEFNDIHCDYDVNGNIIKKESPSGTWQYKYDALNRLIEAGKDEYKVTFLYDPFGRRLKKNVYKNGCLLAQENYLYLQNHEIGAYDQNQRLIEIRVPKDPLHPNQFIPAFMRLKDGHCYRCTVDQLARVIKLSDMHFDQKYDFEITPFGKKSTSNLLKCSWMFSGKREDVETGLVYFGTRYYDPEILRWTTIDPAGKLNGPNLYAYAGCDPLKYVDLDGRFALPLLTLTWGAGVTISLPVTAAIAGGLAAGWILKQGYDWYQTNHNHAKTKNHNSSHDYVELHHPIPDSFIFSPLVDQFIDQSLNSLNDQFRIASYSSTNVNHTYERSKTGSTDSDLPKNVKELERNPEWENITHPEAEKKGRSKFKNKRTGIVLEHDEAKPNGKGHQGRDHFHKPNPNKTGNHDEYLDGKGNPVSKNSDAYHVYPE